jgi:hypothetical protein
MTANGLIQVRKVLVELQIIAADDTVIGEPFLTKAVLPNEFSGHRSRCSGQGLRRHLFTGRAGEPRRPCNELIARLELLKRSDESISCIGDRRTVLSVLIVTKE